MGKYKNILTKLISIAYSLCKHISVAIFYLIVQYVFFFFTKNTTFTEGEVLFWKVLIFLVVYFNASFTFNVYNKQQCTIFLNKKTNDILPELFSIDLIIDLICTVIFMIIFYSEVSHPISIILPILFNLATYIDARRIWLKSKESKDPTNMFTLKLLSRLFFSLLGIFLFFFFAAQLIPAVETIVMIGRLLTYLIILPILFILFIYIRALFVMKSFLKKFKAVCKHNNIDYPKINKPYLTVFKTRGKVLFTLKIKDITYDCNLVSFANIFFPVVFKEDGFCFRVSYRLLKANEKPSVSLERMFGFESENKKIVILASHPYEMRILEGSRMKEFDTGDTCGKYKIFSISGFAGAVERNTLDRKSYD